MAKLGKQQLDWLGSNWYWDYQGAEGFAGRHAVNIQTGATLSVREAQAVQRGQQTLQEAILKRYEAKGEVEKIGQITEYIVVEFSSLAGAIEYARRSERTNYIVGFGRVRVPYPDDVGGYGYRSLMPGLRDYTYYQRENNINSIYGSYAQKFAASPRNIFYVWEKIR